MARFEFGPRTLSFFYRVFESLLVLVILFRICFAFICYLSLKVMFVFISYHVVFFVFIHVKYHIYLIMFRN